MLRASLISILIIIFVYGGLVSGVCFLGLGLISGEDVGQSFFYDVALISVTIGIIGAIVLSIIYSSAQKKAKEKQLKNDPFKKI